MALTEPLVGVPWGRGEWLAHGEDATLVGFGPIVYTALAAAEELGRRGFRVGVVNARFAKPLDEALLKQAATESGLIVTLEEHVAAGGFGASVLEWAEREAVATPVRVLALPDAFIDHGPVEHFLALYGLTPEAVAARVAGWLLPARRRA